MNIYLYSVIIKVAIYDTSSVEGIIFGELGYNNLTRSIGYRVIADVGGCSIMIAIKYKQYNGNIQDWKIMCL